MTKEAGRAAILIAGPTASGKSALAIRLATRLGGTIINADSMQVYRDLRIITARPSEAEERATPHLLYGTVDGATNHSVSLWLADAAMAVAQAKASGSIPIFIGGTGLYFKALTQGLSDIPPVPHAVREAVRAWGASQSAEDLHATLRLRDPATAALLRPTDPQRLLRALEVHAATGESLAAFHHQRTPPLLDATRCVALTLAVDRDILRDKIEKRFDEMMNNGALAEVDALAQRCLDPALPIARAHGVPPLLLYLAGALSLEAAVLKGKMDTRRYIKRQDTFVRNQLPNFRAIHCDGAEAFVVDQFE